MSWNISDFDFSCDNCTSPRKKSPALSQQPPLKVEVLPSPPFLKFGWRLNPFPLRKGGGECTPCNFNWDWQTEIWVINKVITYSLPRTLVFKSCPVFPLWPESSIEVWLTDRQAGETGRPKDKHVGGVITHLKYLIYNIN